MKQDITLYNPYTKKYEKEQIASEAFMRFLYATFVGKLPLHLAINRKFFSKIFGLWADSKISKSYIAGFAKSYNINLDDAIKSDFENFNDFFTRKLKPEARAIASQGSEQVIFPADARNLAVENISKDYSLYVKGQELSLEKLVDCQKLAKLFEGGSLMISRLSPVDYHRFHYPISGKIVARKLIKGKLNSVSPIALREKIDYLLANERVLTLLEVAKDKFCAILEVGATNVGSIVNLNEIGEDVKQGDEMGYFKFGGSCIITIYQKDFVDFEQKIIEESSKSIEYYSLANSYCGKLKK
ncbi:MAG: phosphatidylserine decarboxylase [Opitutales bacterium]